MTKYVIDRFEGSHAVCMDETLMHTRDVHRSELPRGAKIGDTLFYEENRWHIDAEHTAARAKRIQIMYDKIKQRSERK
ncbi:MAG: DUF3006 domain-containing protein [Defluviitaleaceae bacterium]|nr:DUF3006 domain-containing protein [Defluviitaleaceae bacterium]